jgi:hypothetical protein
MQNVQRGPATVAIRAPASFTSALNRDMLSCS